MQQYIFKYIYFLYVHVCVCMGLYAPYDYRCLHRPVEFGFSGIGENHSFVDDSTWPLNEYLMLSNQNMNSESSGR